MPEPNSDAPSPVFRGLCETVHLTAMGVWAGVLLMVGVTAAITFPKLADLDVQIPAYEQYEAEHHRIAAGQVMNQAFAVSDWIGLFCLLVAGVALAALLVRERPWRHRVTPGLVIRLAALALIIAITLFQSLAFRPALNASFEQLWGAAQRGDNERAVEVREKLAPMHSRASFLLASQFVLVLIAGLAGGYDASTRAGGKPEREEKA